MGKNRIILAVTIVITGILTLSGCVYMFPPTQSPTTTTPGNTTFAPTVSQGGAELVTLPSFHQLIDIVEHAVVAINTETVINTGFIQRTVQGARLRLDNRLQRHHRDQQSRNRGRALHHRGTIRRNYLHSR